jgi:hypothetical protein
MRRCLPAPCSIPGKLDLDVVLVDGKAQIQQLQLAVVSVQQVPARSAVLARAAHVLAQAVEGRALVGIALRIVAVRGADVALERLDPVDLVGLLQRHAEEGDAVSNCDGRPRRSVCAVVVAWGAGEAADGRRERRGRRRAVRGDELEATVAVLL